MRQYLALTKQTLNNTKSTRFTSRGAGSQSRKTIGIRAVFVLLLLLVLPVYALSRSAIGIDWRLLIAGVFTMSILTYFAYRTDKRRAEAGEWRIPESTLHLCELLGGWPGAFLGQRRFRHKTAKTSYQVMFWFIVLIHQFAAFDFFYGWKLTKAGLSFIEVHFS